MAVQSSGKTTQTGGATQPSRKAFYATLSLTALAALAGMWYFVHQPGHRTSPVPVPPPAEPQEIAPVPTTVPVAAPEAPTKLPSQVTPQPIATPTSLPAVLTPQPSAPTPARPEASPYTRALVTQLASSVSGKAPVSAQQAQAWKQQYERLIQAGAGAVPAIREFLEQNVDLDFKSIEGGDQLGTSSLRIALFDALRQIGGADAAAATAQIMQTTTSPAEIAILAADLETMAPGQYRDAAVAAARLALERTAQSPDLVDSAPLFEVLQKYGGASALGDLEQAARRWNYYAPLALAGLPDGTGIPSLARLADDSGGSFAGSIRFALQMLAQLAGQYPDAAQALLAQARNNRIPDSAWQGIAGALSGEQMFYGSPNSDVPPTSADLKTYHIASTDQNYRSLNLAGSWTPARIQQQLAIIDQLSAANPPAAQALEAVRSRLQALLGQ